MARSVVENLYKNKGEEMPFVDTSEISESFAFIPTGSFVLDYLIGGVPNKLGVQPCPGWPRSRISQIYGKESSGKTTFALMACAQICAMGETVLFVDYEQAIDLAYAKALGVPVENRDLFELVQPRTLEEGYQIIRTYANYGVSLIVVDSVGAGVPTALANKPLKEIGDNPAVAAVARFWSNYLPPIATQISRTKTAILGIAQTRKQISAMPGQEDVVQGGNAWAFYSSVKVALRYKGAVKQPRYDVLRGGSEKMSQSNQVEAIIKKSKVSPNQHRSGDVFIAFGQGVDNLASAIQIGGRTKVFSKSGAYYQWTPLKGPEIKEKGEEKFKAEIRRRNLADAFVETVRHHVVSHSVKLEDVQAEEGEDEEFATTDVLDSIE